MDISSISALLDPVSQSVLVTDDSCVLYTNPAARACLGADLTGKLTSELFPEEILKNRALCFVCSCSVADVSLTITVTRQGEYRTFYLEKAEDIAPLTVSPHMMTYLRNCATGIKLAVDRICAKGEAVPEKRDDYISALYHYYYCLVRLITQVDSAEKLRAGEFAMQTVSTDLIKLCYELTDTVASLSSDTGVNVSFICEEESIPAVVDPANLELMLLNLFSNSLKNTPAGGSISLTLSKTKDSIFLSMDDTGKGIPDSKLSHLFSPDISMPELSSPEKGLGLGLYISGSIARLHGGVMLVETREDGGTRIRIKLPAESKPTYRFNSPVSSYRTAGVSPALTELSDVLKSNRYGPKFED